MGAVTKVVLRCAATTYGTDLGGFNARARQIFDGRAEHRSRSSRGSAYFQDMLVPAGQMIPIRYVKRPNSPKSPLGAY